MRKKLFICAVAFQLFLGCGWLPDGSTLENGPSMVNVEGGEFEMQRIDLEGGPRGHLRQTIISNFSIGRFPVTYGEWRTVREWANRNGYDLGDVGDGCTDDHPVYEVNWYDAVKWCNALSEMTGLDPVYIVEFDGQKFVYREGEHDLSNDDVRWNANGYRLPTEAEWEFAARGGNKSEGFNFSGSNLLDEVGWYRDNSGGAECDLSVLDGARRGTRPVGQKKPNELGIYDMSGNVWEWCWDLAGIYGREPVTDPRGRPDIIIRLLDEIYNNNNRIKRGGGWGDLEINCRVEYRLGVGSPDYRYYDDGFRLARSVMVEME